MEDGHGPQLTLQGRGAAPPGVLCACKGGADAALLQGGHQPSPPAKPCGGGDRLGAGKGGVSGSQGSGDWWRRQPRGGGRCAVPSRADTAGGERLRGQGWGSGQITAKLRVPPTSSSSPRPYRPQRLKSEAYMGGGGGRAEHRGSRPHPVQDAPATPGLPKPCLAHLTEGGAAKGCRLDQLAVFVDVDQVLAEGPAPGHMDNGHAVLEQKPRHQAVGWPLVSPPPPPPPPGGPYEERGSPRQSRQRTLQASSWSSTPSGCTRPPPASQLP